MSSPFVQNVPKYLLFGFVVCSLFYLTVIGKIDAATYMAVVGTPVLAALGYHQATRTGVQAASNATTTAPAAAAPTAPQA